MTLRTILRIPAADLAQGDDMPPLQQMTGTIEHDGQVLVDVLGEPPPGQIVARYRWPGHGPLIALVPLDEATLLAHLPDTPVFEDGEQVGTEPPVLHMPVEVAGWPAWDTAVPAGPTRDEMLADVTAHRWAVETGGITLPGGVDVHTTIDDQNRITSVIANATAAGVESVDFKAASGWVTLTLTEMRGIAAAIALHVQAAFSAERTHHETIAGLADDELAAYDITTGWPPNTQETAA